MAPIREEWLETILKKNDRKKFVERVLNMRTTTVVGKGENYCSDLVRAEMDVVLGSGRTVTKSVIIKSVPDQELRAKHMKSWGLFKKETLMYREVLPCLEDIIREFCGRYEPMWPEFLDYKAYDMLTLEDLKSKGYKMANRLTGADLDHSLLAMSYLAQFHAATVIANERGLINPSEFTYIFFNEATEVMMQGFHDQVFQALSTVVKANWGPEWEDLLEVLKAMEGKSSDLMRKTMTRDDNGLQVLNHGDFWLNNMMFKYHPETNKPISLMLIDFQISFFNSFGFDLQYFINTSVDVEVTSHHRDKLLSTYQKSLKKHLEIFEFPSEKIPSLEDVQNQFRKASFFGFIIVCTLSNIMKTDPADVMDVEEAIKKFEEEGKVDINLKPYLGKCFTECAQSNLGIFKKAGYFKQWIDDHKSSS